MTAFGNWSHFRSATDLASSTSTESPFFPTFRFSASIEATNEFPMLSTFDQNPPDDVAIPIANNSTLAVTVQSNFSQSFYSLNSFAQLFVFLRGKIFVIQRNLSTNPEFSERGAKKSNFHYTRVITPKCVRSGRDHLRSLAPG